MAKQTTTYGLSITARLPYNQAVAAAWEELAKEGFGVLTEINVKETLKKKLDVEFRPYIILGACNPPIAHQALSAETDLGLLLPCNVIVYATDDAAQSVVAAIDPVEQLKLAKNPAIEPFANEVRARLVRVLDAIAAK